MPQFKSINSSVLRFLYSPTLTSILDYRKSHSLDYMDPCWQIMSLFFNMLSTLVITFLPRSKLLLISWFQSPSAVILKPKDKICHCFHYFLTYLPWSDGTRCHDISFWMLSFKTTFSLSSFTFIKRPFILTVIILTFYLFALSQVTSIATLLPVAFVYVQVHPFKLSVVP